MSCDAIILSSVISCGELAFDLCYSIRKTSSIQLMLLLCLLIHILKASDLCLILTVDDCIQCSTTHKHLVYPSFYVCSSQYCTWNWAFLKLISILPRQIVYRGILWLQAWKELRICSPSVTAPCAAKSYTVLSVKLYSVSQKNPPHPRGPDIFNFFTNGWEFLIDFLHTYYTFISTLDYKFLFSYPRFWRSYAKLSATTQFT